MCDLADDICDVWNGSWPRARKEHSCMACSLVINPGDVYHMQENLYDGSWDRWRHCARCWEMFEHILNNSDDIIAIDPYLNCGQLWEDPPDRIASLAFMLPEEIAAKAEKEKAAA